VTTTNSSSSTVKVRSRQNLITARVHHITHITTMLQQFMINSFFVYCMYKHTVEIN